MAIDGYLKTAAAQLRRAALSLKQDCDEVRKYVMNREQDTNKTVKDLERQIHIKQAELGLIIEASERIVKEHEIHGLQQQISQLQREIGQEKGAKLGQIRQIENEMNHLVGQASNLERQSGNF